MKNCMDVYTVLIAVLVCTGGADAQQTAPLGKETGNTATTETTPPGIKYEPWAGVLDPHTGRPAPRDDVAPPAGRDARLLFSGRTVHGGFGAPQVKLSAMLSEPALLIGAHGGWIVNHAYVFGLAGYGLASRHDTPAATRVDGDPSRIELGYGGLRLAYLVQPHRLVHLGLSTLIGAGGVVAVAKGAYERFEGERDDEERRADHADALFVLEPEVEAELNVVSFMRIALTASYRYMTLVDAPGLSSRKLSAPAGSVAFRFGVF
jgi:hypothetical protein